MGDMDRDTFGRFRRGGKGGPGRPKAVYGHDNEPPFFDKEGRIDLVYLSLPFDDDGRRGTQKDVDALDEIGTRFRAALHEASEYDRGRVEIIVHVEKGRILLGESSVSVLGLKEGTRRSKKKKKK